MRQCCKIFGESLIVATRQFTRKIPQQPGALHIITLFSDERKENGHCLYIFYSILGKSHGWPSENQLPQPEKWMKLSSVECSWTLGICPHQFKCIWVCEHPFSQWKIDSPRFFQPQGCYHSWLWISQPGWIGYVQIENCICPNRFFLLTCRNMYLSKATFGSLSGLLHFAYIAIATLNAGSLEAIVA